MFEFIEPAEHRLYKDRIVPFLENLADHPKLYEAFEDWDQGTFLLANDTSKSIQGGALLLNQDLELLHPRIQDYLETVEPWMTDVWTGMISLQIHQGITGRDFERLSNLFYCTLLADLIAFGVKENIPFLCVTMTPLEYRSIECLSCTTQELWDYALKVKPESSRDGLFHGVLTLIDMNLNAALPNLVKQKMTMH